MAPTGRGVRSSSAVRAGCEGAAPAAPATRAALRPRRVPRAPCPSGALRPRPGPLRLPSRPFLSPSSRLLLGLAFSVSKSRPRRSKWERGLSLANSPSAWWWRWRLLPARLLPASRSSSSSLSSPSSPSPRRSQARPPETQTRSAHAQAPRCRWLCAWPRGGSRGVLRPEGLGRAAGDSVGSLKSGDSPRAAPPHASPRAPRAPGTGWRGGQLAVR